jgi:hypothetical protein
MGLIREPRDVDFYIQSKPWSEAELNELREIIKKRKAAQLAREKRRTKRKVTKPANAV